MPYNYTPTADYQSVIQMASDGDKASSANLMAPIEQALNNTEYVRAVGPLTIRHVDSVSALVALTGMAHNEVALVATPQGDGFPGTAKGIWRFVLGAAGQTPGPFAIDALDDSGCWQWIDYSRVDAADGIPTLTGSRGLALGSAGGAAFVGASGDGEIRVHASGTARVYDSGTLAVESGGVLEVQDGGAARVQSGGTIAIEEGGGITVETGGAGGGAIYVQSGGGVLSEGTGIQVSGGAHILSGGVLRLASGSTTTLKSGAAFVLEDRIQYSTDHVTTPSGTITVAVGDHDEIAFGNGTATVNLGAPTAAGQRVRLTRQTMTATGIITVNASGDTYLLQTSGAGSNHVRWIEFTAHVLVASPVWVPSAYSMT